MKNSYYVVEQWDETRTTWSMQFVQRMLEKSRRLVHVRVLVPLTCLFEESIGMVQRDSNQKIAVEYY
jgi:hypothetical protein